MNEKEVKDQGAVKSEADPESRQVKRVALLAFLVNLVLAGIKAALAAITGSLAITAGAIDSATDSVASAAVYGGLRLSTRKTRAFPYGLYKIENLISVLIAFFIFFAGYEIARQAFTAKSGPPDISFAVIGWLFFTVLVIFVFGQYALRVGRKTGSPTMKAEGRHRQVDVLSSLVVLGSATLSYFQVELDFYGLSVDQIGAALVLIFIGRAGWELLASGMRVLLDASVEPETLEQVRKIVESEPAVDEIRSLAGRNAGRFRFLEIEVSLRTADLEKAHHISQNIESMIREEIEHIAGVVVHYEPRLKEYMKVAVPLSDTAGTVSGHFGEAPYFAIVRIRSSDSKMDRQEIVENPHTEVQTGKGIKVAEWLLSHKIDIVLTSEDMSHKGPSYVMNSADVQMKVTGAQTLEDAVAGLTETSRKKV
ncbi:MAG: cation diffusion facilitator family transporter [bacterium]